MDIQSYQPIELFAKQQQFFEYINKIYRNLVPQTPILLLQENLARDGWVIPINKKEFKNIDYSSFNINTDIISIYEDNNENILHSIQQEILDEIQQISTKKQFKEATECYDAGLYYACTYSLSPIIEGLIENKISPRSIKVIKSFENMTEELQKGLIKDPKIRLFILLKTYIENCYAKDSDFSKDEPDFINRHWIAHGRYKTREMTKVDCLKLFSALYAMVKVIRFCKELEANV